MQINGKIGDIENTVIVSDKFCRRDFILYPSNNENDEFLKFEFHQNRCSLLDNFVKGDNVTVFFNILCNKWTNDGNSKYYTTLKAWKIEKL
jgi:hypothetical protein